MSVQLYTTYAAVRSILGVSDDELPDAAIEIETVGYELEERLVAIKSTLLFDYQTVAAKANVDRSDDEEQLYRRVRLFGAAAAALRLSTGLPLLAPKDIGDGKATLSRFADGPYRVVMDQVVAEYGLQFARLTETATGIIGATTQTLPIFFDSSVPSRDVVVSE